MCLAGGYAALIGGYLAAVGVGAVSNGQNLTIQGPWATMIAINGQNSVGVFSLCEGVTATISGLTIENGTRSGYDGGIEDVGAALIVSNNDESDSGVEGVLNFV